MQEVAGAIVAVHHRNAGGGRRRVATQTADGRADDRLRMLFVGVDDTRPIVQLTAPARRGLGRGPDLHKRQTRQRLGGDLAQDREELLANGLAIFAVGIGAERAGGRAAIDPPHDEERTIQLRAVFLQSDHLRRRDTLANERAYGQELQPPVGVDQAAGRIAPQDVAVALPADHGVIAIGLAARPAGNPRQSLHRDGRAGGAGQISGQGVGEGGHGGPNP